jgi:hypothetical protein
MFKWVGRGLIALMAAIVMTSCTIDIGFPNAKGKSGEQEQENKTSQIEVKVEKEYEDGFDVKVSLQNIKEAHGKWKIKYCGEELIRNNAVSSVTVGFSYGECLSTAGEVTIYAKFSGVIDGKQVTVDTVQQLTQADFDKATQEGDYPTVFSDVKNLAETGEITSVTFFGNSKKNLVEAFGNPDSEQDNVLTYGDTSYAFNSEQKLISVTFENKAGSLPQGMDEIETAFGSPVSSEGAAGTIYHTFHVNDRKVEVAWSNVQEEIRYITVKDVGVQ